MKRTLGHNRDGKAILATDAEIFKNALQQEVDGIKPRYCFYDYNKREPVTPAGWLVWSLNDGCGIVYRREDGKMIICAGVQGDFCYM